MATLTYENGSLTLDTPPPPPRPARAQMIKTCNLCKAYEEMQGETPRCALGHPLIIPFTEHSGKITRIAPGEIRPESGYCEKPKTVAALISLLRESAEGR